jgi:hypothetical protein
VAAAGLDATVAALAQKHAVDPRLLAGWLSYLGVGAPEAAFAKLLDKKLEKVEGWEAVNGWRGEGALLRLPAVAFPHGTGLSASLLEAMPEARRLVRRWLQG